MQLVTVAPQHGTARAGSLRGMTTGRFSPLHSVAMQLCDDLFASHDVVRGTTVNLRLEAAAADDAQESVALMPPDGSAPLTFVLTAFPGLEVHFGKWQVERFPAPAATGAGVNVDDEIVRLRTLVSDIVSGEFTEELRLPWFARPQLRACLGPVHPVTGERPRCHFRTATRAVARELRLEEPGLLRWAPWPRRARH